MKGDDRIDIALLRKEAKKRMSGSTISTEDDFSRLMICIASQVDDLTYNDCQYVAKLLNYQLRNNHKKSHKLHYIEDRSVMPAISDFYKETEWMRGETLRNEYFQHASQMFTGIIFFAGQIEYHEKRAASPSLGYYRERFQFVMHELDRDRIADRTQALEERFQEDIPIQNKQLYEIN